MVIYGYDPNYNTYSWFMVSSFISADNLKNVFNKFKGTCDLLDLFLCHYEAANACALSWLMTWEVSRHGYPCSDRTLLQTPAAGCLWVHKGSWECTSTASGCCVASRNQWEIYQPLLRTLGCRFLPEQFKYRLLTGGLINIFVLLVILISESMPPDTN